MRKYGKECHGETACTECREVMAPRRLAASALSASNR